MVNAILKALQEILRCSLLFEWQCQAVECYPALNTHTQKINLVSNSVDIRYIIRRSPYLVRSNTNNFPLNLVGEQPLDILWCLRLSFPSVS